MIRHTLVLLVCLLYSSTSFSLPISISHQGIIIDTNSGLDFLAGENSKILIPFKSFSSLTSIIMAKESDARSLDVELRGDDYDLSFSVQLKVTNDEVKIHQCDLTHSSNSNRYNIKARSSICVLHCLHLATHPFYTRDFQKYFLDTIKNERKILRSLLKSAAILSVTSASVLSAYYYKYHLLENDDFWD